MTRREMRIEPGVGGLVRESLDASAILTFAAAQTGDENLLLEATQGQFDDAELDAFSEWLDLAAPILDRWLAGDCSEPLPPFEPSRRQS